VKSFHEFRGDGDTDLGITSDSQFKKLMRKR
jgi:hypothetical protein